MRLLNCFYKLHSIREHIAIIVSGEQENFNCVLRGSFARSLVRSFVRIYIKNDTVFLFVETTFKDNLKMLVTIIAEAIKLDPTS